MTTGETLSLEDRSKSLFGNKKHLPIIAAIGRYSTDPIEPFHAPSIIDDIKKSREIKVGINDAIRQLDVLAEFGWVVEVPPEMAAYQPKLDAVGQRTFARVDHPVWDSFAAMIEEWETPPEVQLNLFGNDL